MRIGSTDLSKHATRAIILPRGDAPPIRLLVAAAPLGSDARALELFPFPSPPEDFKRGANGLVLFDPKTNKPLVGTNENDPDHLRRVETQARRLAMFRVRIALRFDRDVEFDADSTPGKPAIGAPVKAWESYCDALWQEFVDSGFSDGEVLLIQRTAGLLGVPQADEIEEARNRYFPKAGAPNPGECQSDTTPAASST